MRNFRALYYRLSFALILVGIFISAPANSPVSHLQFDFLDTNPEKCKGNTDFLLQIVGMLRDSPKSKVEINAHEDANESRHRNGGINYSKLRAKAVRTYLIGAGIKSERIILHSYRSEKLLNGCTVDSKCSAFQHSMNRRVEFRILSNYDYN